MDFHVALVLSHYNDNIYSQPDSTHNSYPPRSAWPHVHHDPQQCPGFLFLPISYERRCERSLAYIRSIYNRTSPTVNHLFLFSMVRQTRVSSKCFPCDYVSRHPYTIRFLVLTYNLQLTTYNQFSLPASYLCSFYLWSAFSAPDRPKWLHTIRSIYELVDRYRPHTKGCLPPAPHDG